MKKKIDPKQIIIDRRSSSADLDLHAKFLREYAGRKLDVSAYESSLKIIEDAVHSQETSLSGKDRLSRKILIDDYWIWYRDLRNLDYPCPGEEKAIEYIKMYDKLYPDCEKCRKILIFDFDESFLKRITEEFLTKHINFDFKVARDLGVFVAYRHEDKGKDELIAYLDGLLKSYKLKGRIQWRIGGRYLQLAAPQLFKSAKILNYEV